MTQFPFDLQKRYFPSVRPIQACTYFIGLLFKALKSDYLEVWMDVPIALKILIAFTDDWDRF